MILSNTKFFFLKKLDVHGYDWPRTVSNHVTEGYLIQGRSVVIEREHKGPKVTKDGVTVAKSIKFNEITKNLGAELVKQVAKATNSAAGDGTTCATVLTQAILVEERKSIATGVNAMDLRTEISMAVDVVVANLKSMAVMISMPEEITQVATILQMASMK